MRTSRNGNQQATIATPLVPDSPGRFLKCEFLHPGRSHKARVARCLVDDAEAAGFVGGPGGRVLLERTGGNLGVGLAVEASVRGYALTLVTDSGYSAAKKSLARRLGATVLDRDTDFPGAQDNGEAVAELLATDRDRYHYLNQFGNPANPATHESFTGPEVAHQLQLADVPEEATVVLVSGLGTGATMRGVSTALRRTFRAVRTVGVEPPHCDLRAGRYGEHSIQGIAVGQAAPFFPVAELDEVIPVSERDLAIAKQRLMSNHRFDVGPSSLANYAALVRVDEVYRDVHDHVLLTFLFDRGEDYG
ncbi:cysteine synthase A [Amycolatopsis lexingtonensis]|uniref:Cysteine synthase A n=1 Tax=Amycolatopsis lexingtonensis TaxID=218822 RepID=A0ABR9HRM2_9PSEU|nr:pyridoxal-phosphate dependent enzyme [Amycolatopsis lexingtonensis]MBE1493581.1 cysteine synthase A [Amycolatopsis lexingtonensis]